MADIAAAATGGHSPEWVYRVWHHCGWLEKPYICYACRWGGYLVASVISPTTWATGQVQKACALYASQWVIVDEGSPLVVAGGAHPHGQG